MKNGSTLALIFAGVLVVVVGAAAGYFYMGNSSHESQAPAAPTVSTAPVSAPTAAPTPRRQIASAAQYTAPGAPDISIAETKLSLAPKKPPVPKPVDPEASETGVSTTPTPDTSGDDSSTTTGVGANPATTDSSATTSGTSQPDASTTTGVNTAGATTSNSDTTTPAQTTDTSSADSTSPDTSGSLFHVQAGAFQSEKNAKILEDALRHKGYAAITSDNAVNGQDSYVVQVGAYKSKVTADEVVDSLQHDGFPASVSIK